MEQYKETWTAAWNFQKKFLPVRNDDEYWKKVYAEYNRLFDEYQNNEFALDLLKVVWNELRRKSKKVGVQNEVNSK